ncbi:hypothetical protein [Chlamydiifrater volucris]|uniref:hypothetical protein n=1 Tax=Chlamydiifrater volucris TaxID=2681470 RepID=UPI001BCCB522|nr:hypothetical protein [Chlamydiifrater volucris]
MSGFFGRIRNFCSPIFLLISSLCMVFSVFAEVSLESVFRSDVAFEESFHPLPLRVMVFGSSFVDIALEVSEDFLVRSGLRIGDPSIADIATIRKIVMEYESEYDRPVPSKRREPVSNLKKQLSRLGILCVDHLEKRGPMENEAAKVQLSLYSPSGKRASCYSVTGIEDLVKKGIDSSKFGYNEHTLVDGHLLFYDDYVEKVLRISKDRENRVILDMSDQLAVRELRLRFWRLLPQVDVIFLSGESAGIFTGMGSPLEACKFLSKFRKLVVIKDDNSKIFFISDPSNPGVCQRHFASQEKAEMFRTGFMFGYLNGARSEYCVSCAESLSSEESLA